MNDLANKFYESVSVCSESKNFSSLSFQMSYKAELNIPLEYFQDAVNLLGEEKVCFLIGKKILESAKNREKING